MMEARNSKYAGNLAQQVTARLAARIQDGVFPVGEKLPSESEIVRQEGVSRTVVREAISKLQAAGLVETRHGIGTFVREPSSNGHLGLEPSVVTAAGDVMELLEVRIAIESEVAALAALRRTEDHLRSMMTAMQNFSKEMQHGENAVKPDFQFHLGMARASGNRYFWEILNTLGAKGIPRSRLGIDQESPQGQEYLMRVNNEHEDIYNAIARGDPEAARAAIRNHLGNSRERMRRAAEARKMTDTGPRSPYDPSSR